MVVGLGEVGGAVQEVLACDGHDPFKGVMAKDLHYDVIHICFPYNQSAYDFSAEVEKYKKQFTSDLVVVHSTVPVGTSSALGAVHSPIRGVHPHIAKSIRTFVKFFGGEMAEQAADIFREKGVKTYCTARSEETEAGKLWDTTQYGIFILLNKEIHLYCERYGLDYNVVYGMFNKTYNEGYSELGREEVMRPYLKYMPGQIGGHCVVQNAQILESPSARKIIKENSLMGQSKVPDYKPGSVSVSKPQTI